jgi:hypothetical protein
LHLGAVYAPLSDTVLAAQITKLFHDRLGRKGIESLGSTFHLAFCLSGQPREWKTQIARADHVLAHRHLPFAFNLSWTASSRSENRWRFSRVCSRASSTATYWPCEFIGHAMARRRRASASSPSE